MWEFPCSWPTVAEIERQHILSTLRRCNGNRTRTAKVLRISVRGLRLKLRQYAREGFDVPEPEVTAGSRCVLHQLYQLCECNQRVAEGFRRG